MPPPMEQNTPTRTDKRTMDAGRRHDLTRMSPSGGSAKMGPSSKAHSRKNREAMPGTMD